MTTEAEFREIRSLLKELNNKVDGLSELLEKKLIVCEAPLPDELEVTNEYETSKKKTALQNLFHGRRQRKDVSPLTKCPVFVEKKALKQLEKLPNRVQDRIDGAIDILQQEGLSRSLEIKKLQGLGKSYRVRVGKHGILFAISDGNLIAFAVLPREFVYSKA